MLITYKNNAKRVFLSLKTKQNKKTKNKKQKKNKKQTTSTTTTEKKPFQLNWDSLWNIYSNECKKNKHVFVMTGVSLLSLSLTWWSCESTAIMCPFAFLIPSQAQLWPFLFSDSVNCKYMYDVHNLIGTEHFNVMS